MASPDQPSDKNVPASPEGTPEGDELTLRGEILTLEGEPLTLQDGSPLTLLDGTPLTLRPRTPEPIARASVADALAEMRAAIAELKRQTPQIGHNHPPEAIETTLLGADQAAEELHEQIQAATPNKTVLERAKARFQALTIEARAILTVVAVTAVKDGAEAAGHALWQHLEPLAGRLIEALTLWISTLP